ncbi:caspase family protein, partial [Asanoa ishikariensis]
MATPQPRRYFIGAATITYQPEVNLDDRPELAEELWRARELFAGIGYEVVPGFGLGLGARPFQDQLREFLRSEDRRPTDVVVVYYTGHGIGHGTDLLLPMADTTDVTYQSVRAGDLTGKLLDSQEPGEVTGQQLLIILDTCYSAAAAGLMGANAAAFLDRLRALAGTPSVAVIGAARNYESATAGAFTRALAAAIGHDTSVGGREIPYLPLDAVVLAVNDNTPLHQHAQLMFIGERAGEFFPNPRFKNWYADLDQQARARQHQRQARERERHDHVMPRAQGLDGPAVRDDLWLFTGRHAALRTVNRWLSGTGPATLIVTGGPGSGKSALLGRLDVLGDAQRRGRVPNLHLLPADTIPPPRVIDRFIHARGHTPQDLLSALAEACEVDDIAAVDSVGALLRRLPEGRTRIVVIIDAIDEAVAPGKDLAGVGSPVVDQVLAPLVAAAGRTPLRLLLGTRTHLVDGLGQQAQLLDLDKPGFADPDSVRQYARACLTALTDASPYRGRSAAYLDAVADAVAANAGDSFLVAFITAQSLALRAAAVTNPHDPTWRVELPREAAEAMSQDLSQRLTHQAPRARDLLLPLAYAQTSGLPWEDLWPELVRTLTGRPCGNGDLDWLMKEAGYYVIETTLGTRSVYRLHHESLAEHLRAARDIEADQAAIVDVLTRRVPRLPDGTTDWARAHPYTAATIATHAAGSSRLDDLVAQPRFLLDTPQAPLSAALPHIRTADGHATADAYRRAATRIRTASNRHRAAYLQLAARCARAPGLAAAITGSGLPLPFATAWASWRLQPPHQTLIGHTDLVSAVVTGNLNGRLAIVSGSGDGTVRVWDAATGTPISDPLAGHTASVYAVAVGQLDGRPIIVSGSSDRTVRVWDATTGDPIGGVLAGHAREVNSVTVG